MFWAVIAFQPAPDPHLCQPLLSLPCSTRRSRDALWGGNARHQQSAKGCLPLFLAFIHCPHERTARAVASSIFVPKVRLEREKCGVPSVLPSFSSPPQACRKLLGLVTHSWRSGLGLGFFFFPLCLGNSLQTVLSTGELVACERSLSASLLLDLH